MWGFLVGLEPDFSPVPKHMPLEHEVNAPPSILVNREAAAPTMAYVSISLGTTLYRCLKASFLINSARPLKCVKDPMFSKSKCRLVGEQQHMHQFSEGMFS